jgi:cytochrome c556
LYRLFTIAALAAIAFAQQPKYQSVASTKQIMAAIQKPAMDGLAAMAKAGGPKDDAEWAMAKQHAAILAESTQLIGIGGRPLDQDLWFRTSEKLVAAASDAVKAAGAKDLEAWKASLGQMGQSCRGCHTVHKKKQN